MTVSSGVDTIQVDEQGVVAFTQALVRIASVNDPASGRSEQPAAHLVAARMREFGWQPLISEAAPGRPNVVAIVDGGGGDGPTLMLAGPFPGRIKVCALADEEGLMIGVHHFVDSGLAADVDAVIVCEPEAGEICPVSRGAIRFRVDFHGRMAHGAMPQHARDPIRASGAFLRALADLEAELQSRHGEHPHLGQVCLTPTVVTAGHLDQINVIPATATVAVDARTVPGVVHPDLIKRVADLARTLGAGHEMRAEVTVLVDRPPVDTPIDSPVVAALAEAHAAVTGDEPTYGGVPGTTDGTILTARGGVPSVVYGPGGKWIAHQADEYVEVVDIVRCARVYAEAARRFLHASRTVGVR